MIQRLLSRFRRTPTTRRRKKHRRLRAEGLEGRRLLAAYILDVEVVQVCESDGTGCTELGHGDTSAALPNDYGYDALIDEIWAQADIEINLTYTTWNNSAAVQLSHAEANELFFTTWTGGGEAPPDPIDGLQFFFVKDHEGTGYDPAVPGSGWVANPLPPGFARNAGEAQVGIMDPVHSTRGRGVMANEGPAVDQLARTFAHEIGHALGLRHVNDPGASGNAHDPIVTLTTEQNLLWQSGSGPVYDPALSLVENNLLTSAQIDAVILNGTSTSFDPDGNGEGPLKPAGPPTYTVTTLDDELDSTSPTATVADLGGAGDISLREAIFLANQDADLNTIAFDLSGSGTQVIDVASALPTIVHPVHIDGTTQSGFVDAPLIGLNGTLAGSSTDGLRLTASDSTISGLAIYNFGGDGIEVIGGTDNTFTENYVGLNLGGSAAGNGLHGIKLLSSSNTVDGSVLSSNGLSGLFINTTSDGLNTITNNNIGTDPTGLIDRGNQLDGLTVFSSHNQIGDAGNGNLISGNSRWGIFTRFTGRGDNTIQGNTIGLDATGTVAVPNVIGIHVQNENNQIGGPLAGQENLISGNITSGVSIFSTSANSNEVIGNVIGTDVTGTIDVGNGADGVRITFGSNNVIGTLEPGYGNLISGNNRRGVLLTELGATNNSVSGNKIGTDITGDVAIGNTRSGIRLTKGASGNVLEGNQISGNHFSGIATSFAETTSNQIIGNLIGTDSTGSAPLHNAGTIAVRLPSPGNTVDGNTISGSGIGVAAWARADGTIITNNYIGTDASETSVSLGLTTGIQVSNTIGASIDNNVIANNTSGLLIKSGSQILISQNSVYNNSSIGIDLGPAGTTANDSGDVDNGANFLQNSPVISTATLSGGTLSLTYQVDSSTTRSAYSLTVEFYVSDGNGQGRTFLGSDTYTAASATTEQSTSLSVTGLNAGDKVVALVSDANGNTSEFSLEYTVT